MRLILQWDPNKRATDKIVLKHPFFQNHIINSYYYTNKYTNISFEEKNAKKHRNMRDNDTNKE